MMNVSVFKLGEPLNTFSVEENSTVMQALQSAGYNIDTLSEIKVNGDPASLDTILSEGSIIKFQHEKVKGANIQAPFMYQNREQPNGIVQVTLEYVEYVEQKNNTMSFENTNTVYEAVQVFREKNNLSLNDFVGVTDVNGEKVGLDTRLENNKKYLVIFK